MKLSVAGGGGTRGVLVPPGIRRVVFVAPLAMADARKNRSRGLDHLCAALRLRSMFGSFFTVRGEHAGRFDLDEIGDDGRYTGRTVLHVPRGAVTDA